MKTHRSLLSFARIMASRGRTRMQPHTGRADTLIRFATQMGGFALCVTILATPPRGTAQVIFETGFEPPTYSEGRLEGQAGWEQGGGSGTTNTTLWATVQSARVASGSQALRIAKPEGGAYTAMYPLTTDGSAHPGQVLVISADVYLASASTQSLWLPIAVYLQDGASGGRPSIHVLPKDGQISYNSGNDPYPTGVYIQRDRWNHYDLVLDFETRQARVYFNGVEIIRDLPFGGTTNQFQSLRFHTQGDGVDEGYYDNIRLSAEPKNWPAEQRPVLQVIGWLRTNAENVLSLGWSNTGGVFLLEGASAMTGGWSKVTTPWTTNGGWVATTVTNAASAQFYRLRLE